MLMVDVDDSRSVINLYRFQISSVVKLL